MAGKAMSSNKLFSVETREALMRLQVCFIDLEKHKKILARNSLWVSAV